MKWEWKALLAASCRIAATVLLWIYVLSLYGVIDIRKPELVLYLAYGALLAVVNIVWKPAKLYWEAL